MTTERKATDWERIEADYRAGILSLREIASEQGVSHVAIQKRAKKLGWSRDLAAKIQAKADELVTKQAVTASVNAAASVTERQIIEANAERIAQVRGEHRSDITRARALALQMLGELEGQIGQADAAPELWQALVDQNSMKTADLLNKVLSVPSRVDSLKKLAETLKTLIALEREAYGLETAPEIGASAITAIQRTIVDPTK